MPKKRLTKIVTKTGDQGETSLSSGERIAKDDARVEAMGAVDELNSCLGLLLACEGVDQAVANAVSDIQHQLFDLGGEIASPAKCIITEAHAQQCEKWLQNFNAQLPELTEFVMPGGNQATATCHLARTICRRAERRLVTVNKSSTVNPQSLIYLNRLSDLLFVIARTLAKQQGSQEVLWEQNKTRS